MLELVYIKVAVDIESRILAGGGYLHADCEAELQSGRQQAGSNLGSQLEPFTQDIVYIVDNIRPRQNRAMEILDARIQRTSSSSDSTITGRVRQTMRDKIVQDRTRLQERYYRMTCRLVWVDWQNLARIQSVFTIQAIRR